MRRIVGAGIFILSLIVGYYFIPYIYEEYEEQEEYNPSSSSKEKEEEMIFLGEKDLKAHEKLKINFGRRIGDYSFKYEYTSKKVCELKIINSLGDTTSGHKGTQNFIPSSARSIIVIPSTEGKFKFYLKK